MTSWPPLDNLDKHQAHRTFAFTTISCMGCGCWLYTYSLPLPPGYKLARSLYISYAHKVWPANPPSHSLAGSWWRTRSGSWKRLISRNWRTFEECKGRRRQLYSRISPLTVSLILFLHKANKQTKRPQGKGLKERCHFISQSDKFQISPCSLTRNITSHSIKNLAFRILFYHYQFSLRECTFWTWERQKVIVLFQELYEPKVIDVLLPDIMSFHSLSKYGRARMHFLNLGATGSHRSFSRTLRAEGYHVFPFVV